MIQTDKIKSYWETKRNLGIQTSRTTDWVALRKSAKHYPKWKWLSKHVTGICGVGIMLQLWKHQEHSSCPRCGTARENVEHILLCTAPSATSIWDNAIDKLAIWLEENDAEPHLAEIICTSLRAWRNKERLPFPTRDIPIIVMEAMVEQDSIGWYNLTNGFISKKWRTIQKAHFKDIGSMKSPILWISRFQKRIWEIPWQMWQHRNEFLHNDGRTIHFQEIAAINCSIRTEYNMSWNGLPESYQHLFRGDIENLIEQNIHIKQAWLMSVWVARDHHTPTQVGPRRDRIAEGFYLWWKKKFE